MNWSTFLGRFHPVIVHLPIGILFLAVLFEILVTKNTKNKFNPAISYALLLGFVSGVLSVILGFLISSEGGYDERLLNFHKFSGIGITVLSFFGWMIKSGRIKTINFSYLFILVFLIISLLITGHLGGMLTHGNDYLISHAPAFIRDAFGFENEQPAYVLPANTDSLIVYSHLIQPVLDHKCNACHNASKPKSGLILDTFDNLLKGGEGGIIIESGYPFQSELFKRITLPSSNSKYMPPKGLPLTYGEIQIIKWWIEEGASSSARLSELKMSQDIKQILESGYGYDTSIKSFVEIYQVAEPEKDQLILLQNNHFKTTFLSKNSSFLDVRFNSESIEMKNIEALLSVPQQITWLDLRNSGTTDEMLKLIGNLPNLTKLRLDGNPITEKGIIHLEGLQYLESISLYNTEVNKECLKSFIKLPALKKLYLGRTQIKEEDISDIHDISNDLDVVLDLHFGDPHE